MAHHFKVAVSLEQGLTADMRRPTESILKFAELAIRAPAMGSVGSGEAGQMKRSASP